MMKNFLARLAVSVALSLGTPALANDANVTASATQQSRAEVAPATGQATKIVNLDDRVTFKQQLEHNIGPVVLMSTFLVPPDQVGNFLEG
jgi:hypothetical protein